MAAEREEHVPEYNPAVAEVVDEGRDRREKHEEIGRTMLGMEKSSLRTLEPLEEQKPSTPSNCVRPRHQIQSLLRLTGSFERVVKINIVSRVRGSVMT